MKFIKFLGVRNRISKNGNTYKDGFSLFLCPYCNNKVEKQHTKGKRSKSCGCVRNALIGKSQLTHGDAVHIKRKGTKKLYSIWDSMKQRCHNKNSKSYKDYGSRGIRVCIQWKNSYEEFKQWALQNGYKEGLTIDRRNNDKGYHPLNCRWVDRKTQQRNTRWNKHITYKGETHCISEWAEILGVKDGTLRSRINKGWEIEKIITTSIRKKYNE